MNKRKILATIVAAATFAGNVQAFGANFTDINDVPWDGAKNYINSVADLGLMAGDYNDGGKLVFRGKGVVTYCETMQLVYNLVQKSTGKTVSAETQAKWTSVMNGYKIPTWVQPAVAYGLENSIVTISDIPGFVNKNGKSVNATRQDVAIIFGRALKDYGTINSGASLSFKDANTVNAVAVPYVDLLNRLGIISGDTDNNFNPKSTINRAEMAVFVSKSYDVMKSGSNSSNNNNNTNTNPVQTQAGSITGTITSVTQIGNNTAITVQGDSSTMSFTGASTTPVLSGSTRVAVSSLAVGDKVVASYSGQDLISVLVTTKASSNNTNTNTNTNSSSSEVSGTYVDITSSYIKIKVNGSSRTYDYINDNYDNTTFYIDNSKSTYSKFKDMADDTDKTIRLVLDSKGEISKAYVEDAITGKFVSMSKSGIKLKVNDSSKSYNFEDKEYDDVTFRIDGSKSTYNKVDDKASTSYTVKVRLNDDDEVIEVDLITKNNGNNGNFVSMTKRGIKVKINGSTESYDYVDEDYEKVTFRIDGSKSTYSKVDDKASSSHTVKLTFDKDDEVEEVDLITKDDDGDSSGTYLSMTSSDIEVKKSGSSKTYKFKNDDRSDVDFEIDGDDSTYSKVKSRAEKGDTIKLSLNSDDRVTKVNLVQNGEDEDEVKGTYLSISEEYIKIKPSGSSSSKKYDFEDEDYTNVTFYYNDSSKKYSYIESHAESGDTVKLELDGSEVTKVYISSEGSGDISGKLSYLSSTKIRVSGDSTEYRFEDSDDCDIEVKDGRSRTLDDYDDLREADNDGKKMELELFLNSDDEVTEIEGYVSEVEGRVESISTSDNSIKVKTNSRSVTYTMDSSVSIENSGSYNNSMSGLLSAYTDKKDSMEVKIKLNKNGYVTKVEASW